MECYYHPSRESSDVCSICGKSICKECGLEIGGKIYCKDCLEKIVGLSLNNQQEEPVRLERQEAQKMPNQTRSPEEVQFSNHRVSEDSPYNIKDNIQYESGLESSYQPKTSLDESFEEVQVPQKPVQDVRQEYVRKEPVAEEIVRQPADQARNEYDYAPRQPQAPPADDYIYPDHSYEPSETSARQAVEDKYERYLDDLYFDEEEIPLNEQLARDEEKYGSLTRNEYQPKNAPRQNAEDDDLERRIREELARREEEKRNPRMRRDSIHNFQYEEEKEPYSATDILLTIILILVIIIVLFYIIYIIKLSAFYPTFVDAIFGLRNPGTFVGVLFG